MQEFCIFCIKNIPKLIDLISYGFLLLIFVLGIDKLFYFFLDFLGLKKYNRSQRSVYEKMSQKKMGRPNSDNPKTTEVKARINKEQKNLLETYCTQKNVTKAEAVRIGIDKLRDDLK